jgi:signal transduction histidine kinase
VDYLVKPVESEILLSKVTVFVELFKKTDQIKQQAAQIAQLNAQLEIRVKKRTAQLEAANRQKDELLKREQAARAEAEAAEAALRNHADELSYLTTALTQSNILLERRNKELDQFVYAASHDLKSPLRAIANIAQWLVDDFEGKLNEETQYYLDLLQARVYRMENLIDGLLQYYRVGRAQMSSEIVDVAQLLGEIVDSLDPPAEFSIEIASEMPTLRTVRVLLEQVFTNLIGNAIKHHDGERGRITITAQRQPDRGYEFAVTDDGPGIDPQFHDKIFGLFQTLRPHTSDNTGIGLALVKKIVDGEQGTIAIDSLPEKGTTIRFTWPG